MTSVTPTINASDSSESNVSERTAAAINLCLWSISHVVRAGFVKEMTCEDVILRKCNKSGCTML